jgi:hypothetical protein
MEGKHTVDVAVLVNPIIVEYLKGIGDVTNTPYTLEDKSTEEEGNPVMTNKAIEELKGEKTVTPEQQQEITDLSEDIVEKEKTGLMSRPKEQTEGGV